MKTRMRMYCGIIAISAHTISSAFAVEAYQNETKKSVEMTIQNASVVIVIPKKSDSNPTGSANIVIPDASVNTAIPNASVVITVPKKSIEIKDKENLLETSVPEVPSEISLQNASVQILAEQPDHGENPRFVPYETNTIVGQHTWGDENSIEVNHSFRYYFSRPAYDTQADRLGVYFSYTGKFDFYAFGTRYSSPVVNRLNNPALHYRFSSEDRSKSQTGFRWYDIALEHISNGQDFDLERDLDHRATAKGWYDNGDHKSLDTISRADMQIGLTGEVKYVFQSPNELYLKGLWRAAQDGGVYWGPYINSNVDFNDFQRVIITWRNIYGQKTHNSDTPAYVQLEWTIGDMGFATDSMNVLISMPCTFGKNGPTIPFALTAHFGPMNTLSNYTQPQRSIGLGVSFDY